MHLVVPFIVLVALFLAFPRSFPYVVGVGVGFCAGGFVWCGLALIFPAVITWAFFWAFIVAGMVLGCVLAAIG